MPSVRYSCVRVHTCVCACCAPVMHPGTRHFFVIIFILIGVLLSVLLSVLYSVSLAVS